MIDKKFDKVVERYFEGQSAWTLHVAICLLEGIDPKKRNEHKEPIRLDKEDSLTTRPFRYVMKALRDPTNSFSILHEKPNAEFAADYLVDRDAFIDWASNQGGDGADHLVRVQAAHKAVGAWGKMTPTDRRAAARVAYFQMTQSLPMGSTSQRGRAKMLEKRLIKKGQKLFDWESLRPMIRDWDKGLE